MPLLALVPIVALLLPLQQAGTSNQLELNALDYFEARGLNVLVFSNWYNDLFSDSKMSGVEIIHHGVRTATNGDVRLNPTPEQWDPIPQFVTRRIDRKHGTIEASLRYPGYDFAYSVLVRGLEKGFNVSVVLDRELPRELEGRAGFNLEFLPSAYLGRAYLMDGEAGVFPLYPAGPMERARSGVVEPCPIASGNNLVLAPEDSTRRVTIHSRTVTLMLYDGRNKAQNGWFVVRSLLPARARGTVLEWLVTPSTIPGWTRAPVIAHSQVGYHPDQTKTAIIELDRFDHPLAIARILKVTPSGGELEVFRSEPQRQATYMRYTYASFDFTPVRENGLYRIEYGGRRTAVFRIAPDVYTEAWHRTLDIFFPVQMDHMRVVEAYRVWHGAAHLDDALQAPVNHTHFDLYAQGPTTDTPFAPGQHIPGLNVGGWFDAGDFDIRTQTQYSAVLSLVQTWELFRPTRDETQINQTTRSTVLHHPDGKPDLLQQIEHGALQLVAQHRATGHAIPGIIVGHLSQYTHLGDAASITDNLVYNSKMDSLETDGFTSGRFDDRWAFTSRSSALNYGSAAALAAASRALRGYNDTLANDCLGIARRVWEEEHSHPPHRFHHGNTTGGPLEEEELKAAVELLICSEDHQYAQAVTALLPYVEANFNRTAGFAVRAIPHMDSGYVRQIEPLVREFATQAEQYSSQNPFGVPVSPGGWGGDGLVVAFAGTAYLLHVAFPDIVSPDYTLRGLGYIFGCHPGSATSFVSGVGTESKQIAYGSNRADFSFIAGGVVPGIVIVKPDFPENKDDWPFLWGENEYVVNLAASYLFLVHAANDLVQGPASLPDP